MCMKRISIQHGVACAQWYCCAIEAVFEVQRGIWFKSRAKASPENVAIETYTVCTSLEHLHPQRGTTCHVR